MQAKVDKLFEGVANHALQRAVENSAQARILRSGNVRAVRALKSLRTAAERER